jgi:hypothetical protein
MKNKTESKAVTLALQHIQAWSNHDFVTAKKMLTSNVQTAVTSTQPIMAASDLNGIDNYMVGLIKFAETVKPGSANILESIGDDRNAMVMVSVKAAFGPNAPEVTIIGSRLYMFDEAGKIEAEQVTFFVLS